LNHDGLLQLLSKARHAEKVKPEKSYNYPIREPQLAVGVLPQGVKSAVAMDSCAGAYDFARSAWSAGVEGWVGFPGYPYLAALSTRPEYRNFAESAATAVTREWIVLNSTETAGDGTKEKCVTLMQDMTDIDLRGIIRLAVEHDSMYGRAQIFLDIKGHTNRDLPLVLSPNTIKKLELKAGESISKHFRLKCVEAMWTTPKTYNALDPTAKDFYEPTEWYVMGQLTHATRLLTIITREVSDMLKPAFNFGGISMSQLAEPYVDNWIRTRQSVSDLISNFSIVTLGTAMDQVLQGGDGTSGGADIFERAELFRLLRNNQGVFLHDKEREEMDMLNAPLSGLDALQAQAQEQQCSVSHTPSVELLGISPTGFGNTSEGEMRARNNWISAIQEAYWRKPIETVLNILQLLRYGVIDPDIIMAFEPLFQMTPKELSEIRKADAEVDAAYIDRNVLDNTEVRGKLARNPESGYQGIDLSKIPVNDDGETSEETGQQREDADAP
jgi:uncharacterized protein